MVIVHKQGFQPAACGCLRLLAAGARLSGGAGQDS